MRDEVWVPVREDQVIHSFNSFNSFNPTPQASKPCISLCWIFHAVFDTYITSSTLISFINLYSLVCFINEKTYTVVGSGGFPTQKFEHLSEKTIPTEQSTLLSSNPSLKSQVIIGRNKTNKGLRKWKRIVHCNSVSVEKME